MSPLTLAVTQMPCGEDIPANLDRAESLAREAAAAGAGLILLQELFETRYFCAEQRGEHLRLARPFDGNPLIARFAALAKELNAVLPISYFERAGNSFFNSLAVADADGRVLGNYRKTHIPNGPGYQEKQYFTPGDTGFRVWDTAAGRIGVGICWDQWFPETARSMALMGAELLLYPTAIGSEPQDPTLDSSDHWQRVMQGHAAANLMPLMASNRIGGESWDDCDMHFYGRSFIAGATGEILAGMGGEQGFATATVDLDQIRQQRWEWGLFRDRRPEMYGRIGSPIAGGD